MADYVPAADAWPVARLRQAGAIPFAKTNLPIYAGDIQSYNDVYGTTNNPHDLERTPGARRVDRRQRSRWGSRRSTSGRTSVAPSASRPTTAASPATSPASASCPGTGRSRAHPAFRLEDIFGTFGNLLFAALSGGHPKDKIKHLAEDTSDTPMGRVKRSTAAHHRDWLSDNERRLQYRERWAEFFTGFDAVLMPVHPRPAIPHDHTEPMFARHVEIGGVVADYIDLWPWIAPAGAAFLPATVVNAGMSSDGLPIGVQIVGPFLHDRTTIRLGKLIAELRGGCPVPAIAD